MSDYNPRRCDYCPLREHGVPEHVACPAHWDWPEYCGHARTEARRHPSTRRWWKEILAKAGQEPPSGPIVPDGTLVVRGYGDSSGGYGRMLGQVMKQLEVAGQPTAFGPISIVEDRVPLDPFLAERKLSGQYQGACLNICCAGPTPPGSILWTMWESSRLPEAHVLACNQARALIVPTEWNADVCRRSGITVPIRVVPLGCDLASYYPERVPSAGFTVLNVSRLAHGGMRKGVEELIAVFLEALGDRPDARLLLKLWPDCVVQAPPYPRVVIDRTGYDDDGMRRLYNTASVYATLTRGEGWGMPAHEAMACGRPIVGPIHTGLSAFLTPECGWPVEWTARPGEGEFYSGNGDWCEPSRESAVTQLRAAYHDPEGRRTRGHAAERRAWEFTWERSARELLVVLREFGLVARTRPSVEASLVLAKLRRDCPEASKAPGCGCNDLVLCRRDGDAKKTREQCYECLTTPTH